MKGTAAKRETNVPWLGAIPSHWSVKKLKFVAELRTDKQSNPLQDVRYVGLEHIESKTGRFAPVTPDMQTESEGVTNCFRPDDVLFGKLRPYLAKAAVADSDGCCSSEILVFRPLQANPGYLKHLVLLDGFIQAINASTFGSKMPRADAAFISQMLVSLPPIEEQEVIVSYLDIETARIDALIAEKRELLNVLDQLKDSRITQILTGSELPSIETGDEWLPKIPRGWSLVRLKFLGQVRSGIAKGKKYEGTPMVEMPYLRVANVQDGYLDLSTVSLIEVSVDEAERYALKPGDVLMNEGGDYDKVGRGAMWSGEVSPCIHQNHVFAVRLEDVSIAPWLAAITRTAYAKFYFMNNAKQSTNLASISQGNVKEFPVVFPPEAERGPLLQRLNEELLRFSNLSEHARDEMNLLAELRSTTITDAVLGRIDVRPIVQNKKELEAA